MRNFNREPTRMVRAMQNKSKDTQKRQLLNCASCGKTFSQEEKTVSYDFERFYCFRCDDER
ncbi:MAG: hypothetical protein NTY91_07240 [Euryarchaeota archaeon]|nr:hypothetical protein [Euryarchaeota archaeon]